jgi:hypothetical protein
MDRWVRVLAVLLLAVPALAGEITREYTEERRAGEDESYEAACAAVRVRLQRRFVEEICGTLIQSVATSALDGGTVTYADRLVSSTMARVRVEVLNADEVRQIFLDHGGLIRITARLSIDAEDAKRFREQLEEQRAARVAVPLTPPWPATDGSQVAMPLQAGPDVTPYTLAVTVYGGPEQGFRPAGTGWNGAIASEWGFPGVGLELNAILIGGHTGLGQYNASDLPSGMVKLGDPSAVSLNGVIHLLPIQAGPLRLAMGLGGGLASLVHTGTDAAGIEVDYNHSGGQWLGQVTAALRVGNVSVNARVVWLRSTFDADGPFVLADRHAGSGVHAFAGLGWILDRQVVHHPEEKH